MRESEQAKKQKAILLAFEAVLFHSVKVSSKAPSVWVSNLIAPRAFFPIVTKMPLRNPIASRCVAGPVFVHLPDDGFGNEFLNERSVINIASSEHVSSMNFSVKGLPAMICFRY